MEYTEEQLEQVEKLASIYMKILPSLLRSTRMICVVILLRKSLMYHFGTEGVKLCLKCKFALKRWRLPKQVVHLPWKMRIKTFLIWRMMSNGTD